MMKTFKCCIQFALLCMSFVVRAQSDPEIGLPIITNYPPSVFNALPQTWCAIEDSRGIMYFGIQGGALEYDGVKWRRVSFPRTVTVLRTFARDKNGRIYYGAYGDFGYLKNDSLGHTVAVSLRDHVPESNRDFLDVWTVHASDKD